MGFFVHSFKARRERDYAVLHRGERDIAKAVLAGWRFVLEPAWPEAHVHAAWRTFDRYGNDHGTNDTREGAAAYALGSMERAS